MTAVPTTAPVAVPDRAPAALRIIVQVAAALVAAVGAAVTGVLEVFLVPTQAVVPGLGLTRVPVALLIAAVVNVALVLWVAWASASRLTVLAPMTAWFVTVLIFAGSRPEGDLLLTANNWVGLALLAVGSAALVITAYVVVSRPAPRPAR